MYNQIDDSVRLGAGTEIIPPCHITGNVTVGERNIIGPYVVIGAPPQHWDYYKLGSRTTNGIVIGNDNVIREFTTIHQPTKEETIVGNGCFLMEGSHVAHDVKLGNGVTLSCGVKLGGHTFVDDGATLGLNSCTHQFTIVGAFSMIGMGGIVTKDIPPFLVYKNHSCYKVNRVGMSRNGFIDAEINRMEMYYALYWRFTPSLYCSSSRTTEYIVRFLETRNHSRDICPVFITQTG